MKPLCQELNNAVKHIVQDRLKLAFDLTTNDSECDSLDKITDYYDKHGRLLIWSGASDNTIFGNPYTNYLFRTWHDFRHITAIQPFNFQGEMNTQEEQLRDLHGLNLKDKSLCEAFLRSEIEGQVGHYENTGEFITDQREFSLNFVKKVLDLR